MVNSHNLLCRYFYGICFGMEDCNKCGGMLLSGASKIPESTKNARKNAFYTECFEKNRIITYILEKKYCSYTLFTIAL